MPVKISTIELQGHEGNTKITINNICRETEQYVHINNSEEILSQPLIMENKDRRTNTDFTLLIIK